MLIVSVQTTDDLSRSIIANSSIKVNAADCDFRVLIFEFVLTIEYAPNNRLCKEVTKGWRPLSMG